eukprot:CFRG6533T1
MITRICSATLYPQSKHLTQFYSELVVNVSVHGCRYSPKISRCIHQGNGVGNTTVLITDKLEDSDETTLHRDRKYAKNRKIIAPSVTEQDMPKVDDQTKTMKAVPKGVKTVAKKVKKTSVSTPRATVTSVSTISPPPIAKAHHTKVAIQLRPYQQAAVDASLLSVRNGIKRQVVSLPVGSGKTVVFSAFLNQLPPPAEKPNATRTLVLAHREELIAQAAARIADDHPHLLVDVEVGKRTSHPEADVIVGSVQSLGRNVELERLKKFNPNDFKLIVIDEAHHAAAATYLRIIDYFGGRREDSHVRVWGCTATARRHDGVSLGVLFQETAFHRNVFQMLDEGYLCPMKPFTVHTKMDLSRVKTFAKDFVVSQLSKEVNTTYRNSIILKAYREHAETSHRKTTIIFATDIDHSNTLASVFNAAGIEAVSVTSMSKPDFRREVLGRLRDGSIPVVINCGIFTEGTDIPSTDCLIMARPTKSSVLFQQMIGRGLRLFPGKVDCLVLDVVDIVSSHDLVTTPTLLGLDSNFLLDGKDFSDTRKEMIELIQQNEAVLKSKSLSEALEMVRSPAINTSLRPTLARDMTGQKIESVADCSEFKWKSQSTGIYITLPHLGDIRLCRDPKSDIFYADFVASALKGFKHQMVDRLPLSADSLTSAIHAADNYITQVFPNMITLLSKHDGWRRRLATQKQQKFVRQLMGKNSYRMNISTMDRGRAADIINKATARQTLQRMYKNNTKAALASSEKKKQTQKAKEFAISGDCLNIGSFSDDIQSD